MSKPILCLDFDGVIHSYTSGWQGADNIPDPPVPGAATFLAAAVEQFNVAVFSSRSNQAGGCQAMVAYIHNLLEVTHGLATANWVLEHISFPREKPPAMVTLDDRALTFTGEWPSLVDLLAFKPWNKRPPAEVAAERATIEALDKAEARASAAEGRLAAQERWTGYCQERAEAAEAEVERLRGLVKDAYHEGWHMGYYTSRGEYIVDIDWDRSATKAALAGEDEG